MKIVIAQPCVFPVCKLLRSRQYSLRVGALAKLHTQHPEQCRSCKHRTRRDARTLKAQALQKMARYSHPE